MNKMMNYRNLNCIQRIDRNLCSNDIQRFFSFVNTLYTNPNEALNLKISRGELQMDHHQKRATDKLEKLYKNIQRYNPSPPRSGLVGKMKIGSKNAPKGVYIYGQVGGGKTTLMDMFYSCCDKIQRKTRTHFNSFMAKVHRDIHETKQQQSSKYNKPFDPTEPVAKKIVRDSWLICFDEFQVTDIADAMILKRLFTHLFDYGVVIVATSNRSPSELYKNGLQRSNFLPFIDILQKKCHVVTLSNDIDYRTQNSSKRSGGYYYINNNSPIDAMFKILCNDENVNVGSRVISHTGRKLKFSKTCGPVLDSSFKELCGRPLSGNDYVEIARIFHTILIRNVPVLTNKLKPEARRFITLIDNLYDNRVRVVISAAAPITSIFQLTRDTALSDHNRHLMDDLRIEQGSSDSNANTFTSDEEVFAFNRTMSRLHEMQTSNYWSQSRH